MMQVTPVMQVTPCYGNLFLDHLVYKYRGNCQHASENGHVIIYN